MRRSAVLLVPAALALGTTLLIAPSAQAATTGAVASVVDQGHTARLVAGYQADSVDVTFISSGSGKAVIGLQDWEHGITPSTGCVRPAGADVHYVECTVDDTWAKGKARVALYLGDGRDTVNTFGGKGVVAHGQGGDDLLVGAYGLFNNGGNWGTIDRLYGEAGDDLIEHGYYAYGGDGGDDILNSLNYDGGNGNDYLFGFSLSQTFHGGPGADQITGEGGNDRIYGGTGNDDLYGGTGNDTVLGEDGNDYLAGNSGNDYLWGGNGTDTLLGGTGTNTIRG